MQPCTEAIVTPPAVFDQKDDFGCVEKTNLQGSGCPSLCLIYHFQQDSQTLMGKSRELVRDSPCAVWTDVLSINLAVFSSRFLHLHAKPCHSHSL